MPLSPSGNTRKYYIAAQDVEWDYIPNSQLHPRTGLPLVEDSEYNFYYLDLRQVSLHLFLPVFSLQENKFLIAVAKYSLKRNMGSLEINT